MARRPLSLIIDALLIIVGAFLALAVNYTTAKTQDPPPILRFLRDQSVVLLALCLGLLLSGRVWLYFLDRPSSGIPIWESDRAPYLGLSSFTEEDAAVFFGRETESALLAERFSPTLPVRAHRAVAVIGPSGVGKSSLVYAGLFPRLLRDRTPWTIVPPITPEGNPTRNLARSLATLLPTMSVDDVVAHLNRGPLGLESCLNALRSRRAARVGRVLFTIDAAEELITLTAPEERNGFLRLLQQTLERDSSIWVIVTIRSEFLTSFLSTGLTNFFFSAPYVVGPIDRAALFRVVEGPAGLAGLTYLPGVVAEIVDDVGGGDALPLLAFTLETLYLGLGANTVINADAYHQVGGVTGAIARQADRVSVELSGIGIELSEVVNTLLRLVKYSESGPTQQRLRREGLGDQENIIVDAFVAARLLTTDIINNDPVVKVTHEALLRQWPPLRQAVELRAEDLRHRTALERWAADWDQSGRQDSYLLTGQRLRSANEWTSAYADIATIESTVAEFLRASFTSDRETQLLRSNAIAARALAGVDKDPEQSLLLALAAADECAPTPAARRALLAALLSTHCAGLLQHRDIPRGISWSPNGLHIATASNDGAVRIWEAKSQVQIAVLSGHTAAVRDVCWAPAGAMLASSSHDGSVRVWDVASVSTVSVLRGHANWVRGLAWSPDGHSLATASRDRTVRIWDTTSGETTWVYSGHTDWVEDVSWSPDGHYVATASHDGTAHVLDPIGKGAVRILRGHEDWVRAVAWAPSGRQVATGSSDRSVRLWDLKGDHHCEVLSGHDDVVRGVAWAPDGTRIASASSDRTVRVWSVNGSHENTILRGHTDWVRAVAWSPDSRQVASASSDGAARIWDVDTGSEFPILRGHDDAVFAVAWSPRQKYIVTGSRDRTARIWDATSATELTVMRGHSDWVEDVAWSPDGSLIVTASHDRTLRLWNAPSGTPVTTLTGHDDVVVSVDWSPVALLIASASHDQTARIWDVAKKREVMSLLGHSGWLGDVEWSPNGGSVATASHDKTARVWDTNTGSTTAILKGHENSVVGVAWSSDGARIGTASQDRTARIWDLSSGCEVAILRGHDDAVETIAWSPDDRYVVTASHDRTVRLWDARTGAEVGAVGVHSKAIESALFSPSGRQIATASRDGTARLWSGDADLSGLTAAARRHVFRELTDQERRSVMLSVPVSSSSFGRGKEVGD
jgi:WD40 repeat protein